LLRQLARSEAPLLDSMLVRIEERSGGRRHPDDLTLLSVRWP
jgi:hypothetical protein